MPAGANCVVSTALCRISQLAATRADDSGRPTPCRTRSGRRRARRDPSTSRWRALMRSVSSPAQRGIRDAVLVDDDRRAAALREVDRSLDVRRQRARAEVEEVEVARPVGEGRLEALELHHPALDRRPGRRNAPMAVPDRRARPVRGGRGESRPTALPSGRVRRRASRGRQLHEAVEQRTPSAARAPRTSRPPPSPEQPRPWARALPRSRAATRAAAAATASASPTSTR